MDALVVSYLEWRNEDEKTGHNIPVGGTIDCTRVVVEELDVFCECCSWLLLLLVVSSVNPQTEPQKHTTCVLTTYTLMPPLFATAV